MLDRSGDFTRFAPTAVLGAALCLTQPVAADALFGQESDRIWQRSDGALLRFMPIGEPGTGAFVDASGTRSLRGGNGRYRLTRADGTIVIFDASDRAGGAAGGSECPAECDAQQNPPPGDFGQPQIAGATPLDLRPGSCRSYFSDFAPIERGSRIEQALGRAPELAHLRPTIRSFPLADFISDDEVVVVHSRDLAAPSLDAAEHPAALYELLLDDAEDIQVRLLGPLQTDGHIERQETGSTTRLEHDPTRQTVMVLLIRHGIASPAQRLQIQRAREQMLSRFGISLRVITIP